MLVRRARRERALLAVPAALRAADQPPTPAGPPFPEPEIGRAVYDFAGVFEPETIAAVEETDRSHRGADEGRGRGLHAGRRLPHDRGDRAPRAGTHRPVGRRPQGLRRRPRDLLRLRAGSLERAGPALRGARVRRHVPDQQRTPADLRERHAPAPPRGRLGRGDPRRHGSDRRGGHARRTPLGSSRAGNSTPSSVWSVRRWSSRVWLAGGSSTGGATARTRSTSTRRRSTSRPRHPTSPPPRARWSWTAAHRAAR